MLYETDRPQWTAFQVFKRTHQIIVFIKPCFAWSIKSRGWCVPCTCPADPHTGTMSFVGSIRWAAWALQCFRLCSFAPLFLPLRSGCSKPKTSAEQSVAAPAIKVKFYSRCKILGKVAESFSKAIFTHLVLFKIPTFFGVFLQVTIASVYFLISVVSVDHLSGGCLNDFPTHGFSCVRI